MTEQETATAEAADIHKRLTQKFPEGDVGKVPGRGGGSFSYVEARTVMDRLDEVVGPLNWSDSYRVLDLATGAVECTLTVHGVSKADVGYPNNPVGAKNSKGEPIDSKEYLKDAYSDALKRAAVHWGIARYLYATAGKTARYAEEAESNGATVREERAPAQAGGNGSQGAAPVALLRVKVAELAGLIGLDNAEIASQVKAQTGVDLRSQNNPPSRMKALDWLEGQIAMQTLAKESQRA